MGSLKGWFKHQFVVLYQLKPSVLFASTFLFSHLTLVSNAYANPEGGVVVGGNGSINQSGLNTTVNQASQNMAIDWQSYNVQQNERVQYIQPNQNSISLNRIVGNNASQIHGRIDANGQVILVNPNGIFFSPTSVINVGGIMASGLDIKPSDFMNGDYIFNEVAGTEGYVSNSGIINAAIGGNVTLLGKQVKNDGVIVAKLGVVNMAAGKQAVVTFDNAGLLGVKITKEVLQNELGIDPAVLNNGNINAEGGRVLLTASVSQDVFSRAVNTGGLVDASSAVVNADGTFTLGNGADVVNAGTLDVSIKSNTKTSKTGDIVVIGENITNSGFIKADNNSGGDAGSIELHATDTTMLTDSSLVSAQATATGVGGKIKVLGNKVGLIDNAQVNASGDNGGGEVLIGGDKTGNNKAIRNAEFIYLGENTKVSTDSLDNGNGGKLITFASDTARIFSKLTARGGLNGGNGGFIETSGLRGFVIDGAPDISAPMGRGGEWLIDPFNITILSSTNNVNETSGSGDTLFESNGTPATIDESDIRSALDNGDGTIVTIQTGSLGDTSEEGNIIFSTGINYQENSDATLILNAANDIILDGNSILANNGTAGDEVNTFLNIELNANFDDTGGGDVLLTDAFINTNGGSFTATGVNFISSGGEVNTVRNNFNVGSGNGLKGGDVTVTVTGRADSNIFPVPATPPFPTETNPSSITIGGNIVTDGAAVNLISNLGASSAGGGSITTSASIDTTIQPAIIRPGRNNDRYQANSNDGTVSMTADGAVSIGGSIITEDKNVTVTKSSSYTSTGAGSISTSGTSKTTGVVNILSDGTIISGASISTNLGDVDLNNGEGAGTANITINNTIDTANDLDVKTKGSIISTSGDLTVAQTATFNAIGAGNITLNNFGNDFNRISLTNGSGNVVVHDESGIVINSSNVGAGSLTINAGLGGLASGITQSGTITQSAGAGAVTLNAGAGVITLADSSNEFIGDVALNNSGNNNVSIRDANSLQLSTSNVGSGSLTVRAATGITQAGAIVQEASGGNVDINAGAGVITLANTANDFTGNVSVNNSGANDVVITDANSIGLSQSSVGRNLTVNSIAGDITEATTGSGLNVSSGAASFSVAGGRSILLQNINNNFNTYLLATTGTNFANISLWRNTNIDLGSYNVTNDLNINAVGTITNSAGGLVVGGNTILNANNGASQNIILNSATNNFNTVNVTSANDLTLRDTGAIGLAGLAVDGDLTVTANGDITQSANIVLTAGSTARINSGTGNIVLDTQPGNDFKDIVLTAGGSASVSDTNAINIGDSIGTASNVNGNLTVNANGNIDQTAAITMGAGTTADFNAGNGQINLGGFNNDFNIIKLASSNTVSVNDTNGGVTLGTTNITGSGALNVTSTGAINDNSEVINVSGLTTLDAGSNAINMNSVAHDFNQLNVTNASLLAVNDSDNLTLGALNITGSSGTTLDIQTNGLLNQTAAITSNGNTVINSGNGGITLNNNNNDFVGTLALNNTSGNITINDQNSIDFATSNIGTGSLTVNAGRVSGGGITQTGGQITQSAGAGNVTLNAETGVVTLNNAANDFVGEVAVTNSGATNNVVLNDVNDIALAQSVISGDFTVTAGTASDITQNLSDNGLRVSGDSSFNVDGVNVGPGRSIILGNVNNQLNGLSLNAKPNTGASLQDVTIANNAALNLQTFDLLGDLNVNITGGGNITNTSGSMVVRGLTTLSTSGDIDLSTGGNNFNQVLVTLANNVDLTDINNITVGDSLGTASVINGNLTINANGNIGQTAAITMGTGTIADFNAGSGQINLAGFNNDFKIIKLASSNTVSVNDNAGGITLGASNIIGSGTLNVTANGAINDNSETINVAGLTTLDAGSNAITLNSIAHDVNQVNVTNATSLAIRDSDNLTLGNLNLTGSSGTTLNVQTNGLLNQTSAITSNGATVFNTGSGAITLSNNNNDFGDTVSLSNTSGNIVIHDRNAIDFATSNIGTGSLTVNAGRVSGGGITQTGGAIIQASGAGTVTLNAGDGAVTLGNSANDFVGEVAITNSGAANNVVLNDVNDIALAQSVISGDLTVTAGTASDITQNTSDNGLTVVGTSTFNIDGVNVGPGRSITLGNTNNQLNALSIVAKPSTGNSLQDVTIANNAALDLQTFDLLGNLDVNVTGGGDITNSTGSMIVRGLTTLSTSGDIDLTRGVNDFNQVLIQSANNVSITESNTITIGDTVGTASNINGNLTLTTNGDINQTAAIRMLTGTTARLDAGSGDINLASQPTNDFKNVVLTTTGDVNLSDANNIIIGDVIGTASSIGGDFTLSTNGGITQTAALTMNTGSTAAFSAGNGIIDFGSFANDFDIVELASTNTAIINDRTGIRLGNSNVAILSVNTLGDINDSGNITVTGLTTLDAGSGNDIFLNTGTHNFNDIVITGNNVSITDVGGINIGDQTTVSPTTSSNINGNFNLSSTGNITDNASVAVNVSNAGSTATLAAGGDVALINTDFAGGVNANAGNQITINDATGLTLGTVTAINEIDLTSGSNINGGTLTSARVNLTAETGINVTTQTGILNANNTAGAITVNNTGNVTIESLKTVGDITLNNDANISMQPGSIDADYDTGVIAMTTTTGSFLGLGAPDESTPDITGFSGTFIGRLGSFGTAVRPLVISLKDEILIQTRQSISPRYVPQAPRIVNDLSDIKFDFIDASNAVAGEQLISLEELEDIDPAIFSDVRNYTYGQIAIRLPRDQLFEDELIEADKK